MEDKIASFCQDPYGTSREERLTLYTQFLTTYKPTSIKMLKEREKFLSVNQTMLFWTTKLAKYTLAYLGYSYFLSYAYKHKAIHYTIPGVIVGALFYHDYRIRRLELYAAVEKNEHELISHYCLKHK